MVHLVKPVTYTCAGSYVGKSGDFLLRLPNKNWTMAMAAIEAVSARRIRGPRLTALNPWLMADSASCWLKPPSGPIRRSTRWADCKPGISLMVLVASFSQKMILCEKSSTWVNSFGRGAGHTACMLRGRSSASGLSG